MMTVLNKVFHCTAMKIGVSGYLGPAKTQHEGSRGGK